MTRRAGSTSGAQRVKVDENFIPFGGNLYA